jgi:hypothetical protein
MKENLQKKKKKQLVTNLTIHFRRNHFIQKSTKKNKRLVNYFFNKKKKFCKII